MEVNERVFGDVDGELKELPLFNRFAGDINPLSDVGDFYDNAKRIDESVESLHLAKSEGRFDSRKTEIESKYGQSWKLQKHADATRQSLSKVWKRRREIYADSDLTAGQRRKELEKIDELARQRVSAFNKRYLESIR